MWVLHQYANNLQVSHVRSLLAPPHGNVCALEQKSAMTALWTVECGQNSDRIMRHGCKYQLPVLALLPYCGRTLASDYAFSEVWSPDFAAVARGGGGGGGSGQREAGVHLMQYWSFT